GRERTLRAAVPHLHDRGAPPAPPAAAGVRLRRSLRRRPLPVPARAGSGTGSTLRCLRRSATARARRGARHVRRGDGSMTDALEALRAAGSIAELDVQVAACLVRLSGDDAPALRLAAALASRQTAMGHVCADLPALAGRPLLDEDAGGPIAPDLATWTSALR